MSEHYLRLLTPAAAEQPGVSINNSAPAWFTSSAMLEVVLDEASKPIRTVPGCVPPAPRLVGIELNPGPTPTLKSTKPSKIPRPIRTFGRDMMQGLVAEAGATLGAVLAQKQMSKKASAKGKRIGGIPAPKTVGRAISAPVSSNMITARGKKQTVVLPIDSVGCSVDTDSDGHAVFVVADGGIITPDIPMDPNFGASGQTLFGDNGYIAGLYQKYRWRKLRCFYESIVGTSEAGSLAFATFVDPATKSTGFGGIYSYHVLANKPGSTTIPVWTQRVEIDVSNVVKEWRYIRDAYAGANTSDRLADAGKMAVAGKGLSNSKSYGVLRFVGEVEVSDPNIGLGVESDPIPPLEKEKYLSINEVDHCHHCGPSSVAARPPGPSTTNS